MKSRKTPLMLALLGVYGSIARTPLPAIKSPTIQAIRRREDFVPTPADRERLTAAQAKLDRKNAKRARELRAWGQP